ncbi:MAG: delta-lactam-biosynthetic de-N-acetylase [Clostridium butyricum]|nr:delta-lactam-biosynthetic de-N-acetylase [Clostridium butyricum]
MKTKKIILTLALVTTISCMFLYGCHSEDDAAINNKESIVSSNEKEDNKLQDKKEFKEEKKKDIPSLKDEDEINEENKIEDKTQKEDNEIKKLEEKNNIEVETSETQIFSGDISSLSNESINWSFGGSADENGRPHVVTAAQEKYKNYNVDFIRESEKKIYLTFDEGYENGYTPQILDILKAKNIKATFFITMGYAKSQPELVQRMINEGHVVGNHSTTHPEKGMPSLSLSQQKADIEELHNYVKDKFGYEMYLFRYPAGIYSEQSLALMSSLGYKSVFWSFAYADWDPNNQPDEAQSLEKLTTKLHPGAIYLLHAVSKTNTDILSQFIDNAQSSGYEFVEYNN